MTKRDVQKLSILLNNISSSTIFEKRQVKNLPLEVWQAIQQLVPTTAVETVIARRKGKSYPNNIEVYLFKRPADAPSHQGMWHTPGSFLRRGESIEDIMKRISKDELITANITNWQFIDIQNNNLEQDRHVICLIHLVQFAGKLSGGKWFLLNKLPEPIVNHHRDGLLQRATFPLLTEPYQKAHPDKII